MAYEIRSVEPTASPIEVARARYKLTKKGAEYFATIYLRIYLDLQWTSEEWVFEEACRQFEATLTEESELVEGAEDAD